MFKKVQIKTKRELLAMGYEKNYDPDDFLNKMSGKIVTLDMNSTRKAPCGGIIFFSLEYPEYMIYDYLIKRVITDSVSSISDVHEYTLKEVGDYMGTSLQNAQYYENKLLKETLKKYFGFFSEESIVRDYIDA